MNFSPKWTLAVACASLSLTAAAESISHPPTARSVHVDTYFGTQVEDPYRWFEDDKPLHDGLGRGAEPDDLLRPRIDRIDMRATSASSAAPHP